MNMYVNMNMNMNINMNMNSNPKVGCFCNFQIKYPSGLLFTPLLSCFLEDK